MKNASAIQEFIAKISRLYPFYSGCGTIADHPLFRILIGKHDSLVWAKTESGIIRVSLSELIGRALFFFGDLDPKITWVIKRIVKPGQVVIDVGANVGLVTVLLSKLVGSRGAVKAFEPNPFLVSLLGETISKNSLSNVTLYEIGLGSVRSEMTLSVPSNNLGRGSLVRSSSMIIDRRYQVPIDTLDHFFGGNHVGPSFIKIDVEGFESQVFEGGKSTIERFRPVILLEENDTLKTHQIPESFKFLLEREYRFVGIPKSLWKLKLLEVLSSEIGKNRFNDYIAIPKEKFDTVAQQVNILSK